MTCGYTKAGDGIKHAATPLRAGAAGDTAGMTDDIAGLETAADDDTRAPDERRKLKQAADYLGSFATQVANDALGRAGGNALGG
jgi:hypothetical protein